MLLHELIGNCGLMENDEQEREFWRRRQVQLRAVVHLTLLIPASMLLAKKSDPGLGLWVAFGGLLICIAIVALTAWAWRCTSCGAGLKLDGVTCSKCGRVFKVHKV